jgi:hypothetical protein
VPQGGGALGAYQAGVYKALPEASTKRTLKRQHWLEMPAEGAGNPGNHRARRSP